MDNISIAADYVAIPSEKLQEIINNAILKDRARQRKKKTARRKQKVARIKYTFCLGCMFLIPPFLMVIHWFIFGY